MDAATWTQVVDLLELSPQQTRIVELLLYGLQDREIAAELDLTVPTIRTYLGRIYVRFNVNSRLTLVLHVFRVAMHVQATNCHS